MEGIKIIISHWNEKKCIIQSVDWFDIFKIVRLNKKKKCIKELNSVYSDDGLLFNNILSEQNEYNTFGSFGKSSVSVSQLYPDVSTGAWMTRFPVPCELEIVF